VRFKTYQTTTTVSICDPICDMVIADQIRPKLRWRRMLMGPAALPSFNFKSL